MSAERAPYGAAYDGGTAPYTRKPDLPRKHTEDTEINLHREVLTRYLAGGVGRSVEPNDPARVVPCASVAERRVLR